MVRRFFRDSAIYAMPAALSRGISFLLFPLFAHYFTPHDYGTLDILITVGSLVAVTVGLEISQGVGRYVAGLKEGEEHRAYASTALLFTIAAYSLFLLGVQLLAGPITDLVLGPHADPVLTRVAAVWMWTAGIVYIAQNQLRWQLRASAYAMSSALLVVVTAACSALFVLVLDLGVMGALLGQLAGATVALAYVFAVSRGTFALRFDWDKCRQMLAFSLPLVLSGLGVFLNAYADRLIIQHLRSLSDVGVYGVGYRLSMVVLLVLVGFQGRPCRSSWRAMRRPRLRTTWLASSAFSRPSRCPSSCSSRSWRPLPCSCWRLPPTRERCPSSRSSSSARRSRGCICSPLGW